MRGALVVDDSAVRGHYVPPAFDQKTDSTALRAPSSAASLNGNVVTVTIIPGADRRRRGPRRARSASPSVAALRARDHRDQGPQPPAVDTSDAGGKTRVTVAGRIRVGADPRTFQRRVARRRSFLGHTFKQLLAQARDHGRRPCRSTRAHKGLRVLAAHDSPTLAVVVQDLGKRSNNFAAEQLLRTLGGETAGRPGTWDKGLEAVARYLDGIGIRRGTYVMKNGSGLYDSNRFSAEQMASSARRLARLSHLREFLASLAVGGTDGTLAHRMGGSLAERYVRAKTGTLANVSCLSGFAGAPGTHRSSSRSS